MSHAHGRHALDAYSNNLSYASTHNIIQIHKNGMWDLPYLSGYFIIHVEYGEHTREYCGEITLRKVVS